MWFRKRRSIDDFKAEIESHLAIEADEIRAAQTSDDPDAAARRAFGNIIATHEKWYEQSRSMFFDSLAAIGAALGLIGALLTSSLLSKLLYQVAPTDPLTFGLSVFVLLAAAAVACWAPSRRASRIDPILALRQD